MRFVPAREVGFRRGTSHGFFGNVAYQDTEDGAIDELGSRTIISHFVNLGRVSCRSSIVALTADCYLKAPVEGSSLELASVVDYTQQRTASDAVFHKRNDKRWTEKIDAIAYNEQGLNMRELGGLLQRLERAKPKRIDDYLDYLNGLTGIIGQQVEVTSGHLVEYQSNGQLRVYYDTGVVKGANQGICFGPAYDVDQQTTSTTLTKRPRLEPVLALLTQAEDDRELHIIHVPLSAINTHEYI